MNFRYHLILLFISKYILRRELETTFSLSSACKYFQKVFCNAILRGNWRWLTCLAGDWSGNHRYGSPSLSVEDMFQDPQWMKIGRHMWIDLGRCRRYFGTFCCTCYKDVRRPVPYIVSLLLFVASWENEQGKFIWGLTYLEKPLLYPYLELFG